MFAIVDWNIFWASFAAALPAMLTALAAFIQSLRNGKATRDVHSELNSRLSELLETSRRHAYLEGLHKGAADERLRQSSKDADKKDK
jgi:hypothetical protein